MCSYLFLWYILLEERWLCSDEANFHLFPPDCLSHEKRLHLYKLIFLPTGCTIKTGSYISFLGKMIEKHKFLSQGCHFSAYFGKFFLPIGWSGAIWNIYPNVTSQAFLMMSDVTAHWQNTGIVDFSTVINMAQALALAMIMVVLKKERIKLWDYEFQYCYNQTVWKIFCTLINRGIMDFSSVIIRPKPWPLPWLW